MIRTLNLEEGMPTVDEARRHLIGELQRYKSSNVRILKLIHGYGSSGVGGALRSGIRASLARRKQEGAIRLFIPGERWNIFEDDCRKVLDEVPEMKRDHDLKVCNPGVSIILL